MGQDGHALIVAHCLMDETAVLNVVQIVFVPSLHQIVEFALMLRQTMLRAESLQTHLTLEFWAGLELTILLNEAFVCENHSNLSEKRTMMILSISHIAKTAWVAHVKLCAIEIKGSVMQRKSAGVRTGPMS